ncbi:MAG: DNA gyrase subunit A [Euryarchaeota archaeon]|nr:DNA gyrase subunit A [Euryarchaeota archaeon]
MTSDEKHEETRRIIPVNIEDEMKTSYINYAMSVIIGRAIPDIRDGLKPVHRRTLFAMGEMGNTSDKPFKKSARVVGEVMGKYHPHGDSSIYDTVVKMAQPFSYRHTLVEGQGNFGSIDGDSAAAMRYTEVRLDPMTEELLSDINKETVDFTPNFDESLKEPVVLPAKVPNLLLNGSTGIAVGMATNMPPHNLREVCNAISATIDNPEISTDELMGLIPAPDFPTGGIILGTDGIRDAYRDGRGKLKIRGVATIEEDAKKPRIIITEIPFQVNKARMIEYMADLVRDKKIDGISDLRDESDKDGIRVVIELKKGTIPLVVLNQLYKHTQLETTFGIINLAIVGRQPKVLSLREIIHEFLKHRIVVIRRRTEFDLKKAEDRVHILKGLLLALESIDEVIATIRGSKSTDEASLKLIDEFGFDKLQTDAILKMQLRRLAALEHQKIIDEKNNLMAEIERLNLIISDEDHIFAEIRKETVEIGEKYGDDRRTKITHEYDEINREDLIEKKQVLVSLTSQNYIKHMPLDTYKGQHRGGRGIIGMSTKEGDFVNSVFVASTHDYLLCFTNTGRVYWLKVYDIPEGSRTSRGKAIVNLLNLDEERVTAVIPVSEFRNDQYFFFATRAGTVAKIAQDEFSRPRQTGINAITLREGDELIDVKTTDGNNDLMLTTRHGQSLRFNEQKVRTVHRNAIGVKGIKLRFGDVLQNVEIVEKDHLLTITENGYGKRTEFDEFRGHGRATMGVRNIQISLNGGVVSSKAVYTDEEIILMSSSGIVIRTKVSEISIQKRGTRGVRIMKLDDGDRLVGFTILNPEMDDESEITENVETTEKPETSKE